MKTRLTSLLLALAMVLSVLPVSAFAMPEAAVSETAFNGTVLKITTSADFAAGVMENLDIAEGVGNGAVTLQTDALSGAFVSQIYNAKDFSFNRLVATWNSSIYDGSEVEIWGRVRHGETGEWSQWLSWGAFTPFDYRGGHNSMGEENAIASIDENLTVNEGLADAFQMMAEIRRNDLSCEAPVLRQITVSIARADGDYIDPDYPKYDAATKTIKGYNADNQEKEFEDSYTYAEEPVDELPLYTENGAVAYNQMKRHPSIGSDICNPTTVTVMMNSRIPELDLLPEEYAENVRNTGSNIFGSWLYATSGAGLYGFEAYVQYANLKIMLQELAKGQAVGVSVKYQVTESDDPNVTNIPHLDGVYSGTGGHIIALTGYVYEGEMENGYLDLDSEEFDPEKLYIYSSDSYCDNDENAYRKYCWAELEHCWKHNILYIIPSTEQEENVDVTGVVRVDTQLEENETNPGSYVMVYENGEAVDMTRFISGRGRIGYTITDAATGETLCSPDPVDDGTSIAYQWPIRVTANNRFFYDHIICNEDGILEVDTNAILREQNMREADITMYAMSDRGYRYTAVLHGEMQPEEVTNMDEGIRVTSNRDGNLVTADVSADGLTDSTIRLGLWIPEGAAVGDEISYTLNGETYITSERYTDPYDFDYAVVELDVSQLSVAEIHINWGNDIHRVYSINLLSITLDGDEIAVVKGVDGSVIHADLTAGRISDTLTLQNDGSLALKVGAAYGEYYSPVYNTEDWKWEYALGNLNAYTPGTSVAELQVRAYTQKADAWSDWYSFGTASVGQPSASSGGKDDNVNMNTDVFTMRGSSSVANGLKFQIRVILTGDGKQQPALYNAGLTIKKSSYNDAEAADDQIVTLPESAEIAGVEAYSRYAYRVSSNNNIVYRENYPYKAIAWLSALNGMGEDLLFEEVAFALYDWDLEDFNSWTLLGFAGGKLGYESYVQYGANAELIQRTVAQGKLPIVLASGAYLDGTSSNKRSMTLVYGYYTTEDGTVMFKTICPRGDMSELAAGDVYGEITADALNTAIANYSSTGGRGAMYVIGDKTHASSWVRKKATAVVEADHNSFTLSVNGKALVLSEDFQNYSNFDEGGTITYTLSSETNPDAKLAKGTFYYDLSVNSDGSIAISEHLKAALLENDTATVYVIYGNGVTYVAKLTHTHLWDEGVTTKQPSAEIRGEITYTCSICGGTYIEYIPCLLPPVGPKPTEPVQPMEPVQPIEQPFTDVDASHKAYEAIRYLYEQGLMEGTGGGQFEPDSTLTRSMVVTILYRLDGKAPVAFSGLFSDVEAGLWYSDAIEWAAGCGIVNGVGGGRFDPSGIITREQLAAILQRYAAYKQLDSSASAELDAAAQVSGWATANVQWAVALNLLEGGASVNGTAAANRAEVAMAIYGFIQALLA